MREVVPDEVRALKARPGADLALGGADLVTAFRQHDLVDEYRLFVHPYVQGRGRRLFPGGFRARLELLEHHAFTSHVTYARWAPRKD